MTTFVRSALGAVTALLFSVGPVWATDCAPYVSGWYFGGPAAGYLVGQTKITAEMGFDWILGGSITEEFCVGTYHLTTRDGSQERVRIRCDTYTLFGLF